jgi:hypothetical protein
MLLSSTLLLLGTFSFELWFESCSVFTVESLHFWKNCRLVLVVYLQPLPLSISLCARPPPSLAAFSSPSCPAPLVSAPCALQRRARRSPPRASPLPAPPCRAAATRAATHAARLASSCFACTVLLLVLKLAEESLSTSFTHSTTQHCFFFLPPLDYPCRSSAAASVRRRQPPPPPHTRKPVLLQHRCNPLKLTEQSNSIPRAHTAPTTAPVSSSSAAAQSRRRPGAPTPLSPCQAHRQHHVIA